MSDEDSLHEAETTARGIEGYRLAIKKTRDTLQMYPLFFYFIILVSDNALCVTLGLNIKFDTH